MTDATVAGLTTAAAHNGAGAEKAAMPTSHLTDATVARVLAELPAFERWANQPLDPELRELVRHLDEQALLSLTAYALNRVAQTT